MRVAGRLSALLVLCLILSVSATAEAQDLKAPQRIIQEISDRFQSYLSRDAARLEREPAHVYRLVDDLLLPYIDFSRVSRLALGRAWRQASEAQKRAFSSTFKDLLVGTYADLFLEHRRWEIKHLPLRLEDGATDVRVRTEISFPSTRPVSVVYRMNRAGQGWVAYDVTIEGVSLVTSYRAGFGRKIKEVGVDGLVTELEQLTRRRHRAKNGE